MVNIVVLLSDGDIKDLEIKLKSEDRNKPFNNIIRYKKKFAKFTDNINIGWHLKIVFVFVYPQGVLLNYMGLYK